MNNLADCETPNRPFLVGHNKAEHRAVLFRPRCKMWSCPVCSIANRGRWAVRGYHGAEELIAEGKEIDFLTLTSHENLSPAATIRVFRHAWDQLNKRMRRAAPGFEYLCIPEQHQDGRLHAHLIETTRLGKRWFKDNARECGLGYMADEKKVYSPEGAAWYVVKYLSKNMADTAWPDDFRRIRTSRGWPKLPELDIVPGWEWRVLKQSESLDETYALYEEAGYHVILAGSSSAWDYVKDGIVDS